MWLSRILVVLIVFALCASVEAQQPKKVPRIGCLSSYGPVIDSGHIEAFRRGMRELGYEEGKNITIEYRYAEDNLERLADLAAEFVRLRVDVIVAGGGPPTRAAKNSAKSIPVVMINISDPVALGFVTSLAKPGGNITGLSSMQTELGGKRLELLKEIVPKISRVAVLVNRDVPGYGVQMKEVEAAAPALGLQLQALEVRDAKDLDKAFAAISTERAGALIGLSNPTFGSLQRQI